MPSIVETFTAHAEERLYREPQTRPREQRRRALAVVATATIYLALVVAISFETRFVAPIPPEQEIPVEIVVEPPPPPPPPAAPQEKPPESKPTPPPDLTPATDAPRSGDAEKDTGDQEKEAKAAPPATAPTPEPTPDTPPGAEAQDKAPTQQATTTPEPQPTAPPAPPLPIAESDTPPPAPQVANLEPPAPGKPTAPAARPAPAILFPSVPDIDFGGAAMKSPISGGHAKATYLTMVYGKIKPHFHVPAGAAAVIGRSFGVVVFSVDSHGNLVSRWIAEESGSHELDRAAFDAVGAAAPFPPPGADMPPIQWKFNAKPL